MALVFKTRQFGDHEDFLKNKYKKHRRINTISSGVMGALGGAGYGYGRSNGKLSGALIGGAAGAALGAGSAHVSGKLRDKSGEKYAIGYSLVYRKNGKMKTFWREFYSYAKANEKAEKLRKTEGITDVKVIQRKEGFGK
jgi:hypothetical protein